MHGRGTLAGSTIARDRGRRWRHVPQLRGGAVRGRRLDCRALAAGLARPQPSRRRYCVGGDKRSHRIEAFRAVILATIEAQKDITLAELAELLHHDHGASFAISTIWRFLDRHDVTFKKNGTRQRAGTARRRWPGATPGSTTSLTSIRGAWSSSTRPAPRPRWPGCAAGLPAGSDAAPACRTGTGKRRPSWARSGSRA